MTDAEQIIWLRASYRFHTFSYRDPRAAFSVAVGLPVVSPTAVLLGIVSTLYCIGDDDAAKRFLAVAHLCRVAVDAPDGVVFFRAFHQLRRYETDKNDKSNPRLGMTLINQGIREYGLVQGAMTLWVGVPEEFRDPVRAALRYRSHIGTHDSLCSLVEDVQEDASPQNVIYDPPEVWQRQMRAQSDCTIVTLARFVGEQLDLRRSKWFLSGGNETELVPYLIPGHFEGTTGGKIYRKNKGRSRKRSA